MDKNEVIYSKKIFWGKISASVDSSSFLMKTILSFFRNNLLVVGENHANLPYLVKIIAQAFCKNKFMENDQVIEVARRMCNIVKQVQVLISVKLVLIFCII